MVEGAAANQKDVQYNYDSAKATIRRATRWGKSPMKEFAGCMARKEKSLTTEKNQSCEGKSRRRWAV